MYDFRKGLYRLSTYRGHIPLAILLTLASLVPNAFIAYTSTPIIEFTPLTASQLWPTTLTYLHISFLGPAANFNNTAVLQTSL